MKIIEFVKVVNEKEKIWYNGILFFGLFGFGNLWGYRIRSVMKR
jgi:hypothetical protein